MSAIDQLKRWRKAAGMSQCAFAQLVGVHQSTINRWEMGLKRPDLRSAFAIARVSEGEIPVEAWLDEGPQ